ncbi:transcriptional regulatory protein YdfI [Ktedonobacteria bacterium brp13]|nr:transcriptional regulatory protein YdfI [Ktedonobacteria bacterium brp13]
MNRRIRVVIADDHLLMRRGLSMTLEEVNEDFELVGEACDGAAVLRLVEETQPDVVLMDIRMPGIDGLEAVERIKTTWPQVAVVMLTTYADDALVLRSLKAGVCGYLLKDCDLETLLNTLRSAARGETLLQPALMARVSQMLTHPQETEPSPPSPLPSAQRRSARPFELTERECEILAGVARGERSKEIGLRLGLTRRTVDTYLTTIFNKLGVDSRAAAVAIALEKQLLPPSS